MFCQLSSAALSVVETEGLPAAIDRMSDLLGVYADDVEISAMLEIIIDRLSQMQPPVFNHAGWIVKRGFAIAKRIAR